MTAIGDPDDPIGDMEDAGENFESVDRFLDAQRRLLDDLFDPDDDLPPFGGASLEDEPDELDP